MKKVSTKKYTRDSKLMEVLNEKIRWDLRLSKLDLLIKVKNGAVTLYGGFDKTYRKKAAINIITTTQGVLQFIDKSEVSPNYSRTDEELKKLVDKQLHALQFLMDEWIQAKVTNGVIEFHGHVFRSRLKAAAARIAWSLSGVTDCINLIQIKNPQDIIGNSQDHLDPAKMTHQPHILVM
jgi:osmotically-inducible protein OsmY